MKPRKLRKYEKYPKKMIMIKRSINVTKTNQENIEDGWDVKKFIFNNSNYRRKVWNDFVEEYRRCRNNGICFKSSKFKGEYFYKNEYGRHDHTTTCVGISEQVAKDLVYAIRVAKVRGGGPKFRKFDKFYSSFKVHTKSIVTSKRDIRKVTINSRFNILSTDKISFRVNRNEHRIIHLKEDLIRTGELFDDGLIYYFDTKNKFMFNDLDIKEVSFIHDLGKFYICISVEARLIYETKNESYKRLKAAGIDTGIHNPICIVDSSGKTYICEMDQKTKNRIHYLERRTKRLQHIMDRKYLANKKAGRNPYSKNYMKVQKKFRITWRKITNIKLNWRRHVAKSIATRYKTICVDRFKQIETNTYSILGTKVSKYVRHINMFHSMYSTNEAIIDACWTYKTKYIKAPENTTKTCSICGFINPHLSLKQRDFECESCGYGTKHKVDRDINAAQNCYNHIFEL